MKKDLTLKHEIGYNKAMDLLTEWLSKIQFDLVEDNSKKVNQSWEHFITHNKSYQHFAKTNLPKTPKGNLEDLTQKRRSVRQFDPNYQIDLKKLSAILSNIKDHSTNDFPKRGFPSAGALYPSNTYCIVNNSSDIAKGLYFFNPKTNCLELLYEKDLSGEITSAISDENISMPSVIFILTNSYYMPCIKYGARGFLYSMIEVGALAQTINLSCIQNDLECVWLGGFADKTVKEILDINEDLEIEIPVLLIATGKAKTKKMTK